MAKFKAYDYRQRVLLPVCLEDQLLPGTLEFAIHTLVETRLDTSGFEQQYRNDETGRAAYDPKILLKIVLLGYSRGLISSRKIEQACRENVVFIALACGQQPDHNYYFCVLDEGRDFAIVSGCLVGLSGDGSPRGDLLCLGWPQAALLCLQRVERYQVRVAPEEGTG